jgi:hypothetical protein
LSHLQSATDFCGQRSTIVQTGQFVLLGQPMQAALSGDTALQLCEQRRNHSEYIEFFGCPAVAAPSGQAEDARGHGLPDQGRDRRHPRSAAAIREPAGVTELCCVGRNNRRRFKFLGDHAVGVGERNLRQRIQVGNHIPRRPFGDQHRSPKAVIVVTQKRGVGLELLNELREQPFAYHRRGERAGALHLGDYPGDDAEKAVGHSALHMWSKPPDMWS